VSGSARVRPVRTEGLCASFAPGRGVFDLELSIEPGEVFGFLGPNGAGKTTTIRLLLDLLRPDSGRAMLFGTEVREGGGTLRARTGFLPGDLRLFQEVEGARLLDLLAALAGVEPRRREEVLDALHFPVPALRRRIKSYSTGMRQMIGLAAAMQHDPELLILDEPTTGLDPLARAAFIDLVRAARGRGRTVFLSSHVLDEVEQCADRVGFIAGGRLLLVETVESLLRDRPRTVLLRLADGRREEFLHSGPVAELWPRLMVPGVVDLEIRAASLEEVFRTVVGREDPV
jgi:ABC-2 type transport system ATP-binding protein